MREIICLNSNWKFTRQDAGLPAHYPGEWEDIVLPHTWNAVDGHDGKGSYYRGQCWYARQFQTPVQPLGGGRVFLEIPAAGQQAVVYVNGQEICRHEGGYSAFRADITQACKQPGELPLTGVGENLLVIACSNENRSNVYPQSADFTFYGGLYRGVNLISVPAVHFDLEYWGGCGVRVTARPWKCGAQPGTGGVISGTGQDDLPGSIPVTYGGMTEESGKDHGYCPDPAGSFLQGGAEFALESWIIGAGEDFTVQYDIRDAAGREVAGAVRPATDPAVKVYVPHVVLWDCEHPYLYTVTATLLRRNEAYDRMTVRTGVRSFACDPDTGFWLNGIPTPLRGVSRHQDLLYKGNALTREEHYRDARIIKELGANTIRLAHYQHSQDFYDACDELGFVVWAEIPFISAMSQDPAAHENCVTQLQELVVQNYNHPCICFWGISNEILIGGISAQLVENHRKLNALCKKLDPTRLTTIAHVTMTPLDSPLHGITDVESYNHYFGWYGGKMEDNGPWLDRFHEMHPEICLGLSEYGCEGILTYHGPEPACKDYSEEYQALYHEHMAKVLEERPWLWSSHVWNMFDFGCAARDEGGVSGRNNKGLVTMDRLIRKDSYYIYKAYWNREPMVHLCGRRYAQRAGAYTDIRVYSNQPLVTLYVNGKLSGVQKGDKVFVFRVALEEGYNQILAVASGGCASVRAGYAEDGAGCASARAGYVVPAVPGPVAVCTDSMTLEKVDREPEIYVLPQVKERAEGVANWFRLSGNLDLKAPMEFPEGKYNIRYRMEEIARSPRAMEIVSEAVKLASGFDLAYGSGMWDMMKSMTPQSLFELAGSTMPEGFAESLNARLIQVDVEQGHS